MKYFACTVYVAVPNFEHKEWSDGGAETFAIASAVNDAGGYNPLSVRYVDTTAHLVDYKEIGLLEFKKNRGKTITKEGGV